MSDVIEVPRLARLDWLLDRLREGAVVRLDFAASRGRNLLRSLLNAYSVKPVARIEPSAVILELSVPWPERPARYYAQKRQKAYRPPERVRVELTTQESLTGATTHMGALVSVKNPRMKRRRE